ncbi:MAG TPA: hypothetical protein VG456_01635 [Candidatus Sulfopaludibacter sp.]|jgi:hypothetical protein|nr:hypothetical protein [Candidatus Sulfopaludibacter sp.]
MGTVMQPNSKAAAICSVAELSEEALVLLLPDMQPPEFIRVLVEKNLFPDAVRFLAHALPKREGVWWGWVCARRVAGEAPAPKIKASLEATEKWIAQPTDENRRAAYSAAEEAPFSTPAGCAGLAAFFSGASLAPPDLPPVPPGEFLFAKAVSGAVIFAAVSKEPEKAPEKFKQFISQGVDVTTRIKLWT